MLRDEIIVMPPRRRLGRARRALKRARVTEMALLMPATAASFAEVPGLADVLAWADAYEKDLTLIGGTATLRAEAIMSGWRVATDVATWRGWRDAAQQHAPQPPSGAAARLAWRVIRPTATTAESDALPDFVAALGINAGMATVEAQAIPPDECYEDAVIATLWDTCDFIGSLPHISNG